METKYLPVKWSISRGRDTEGYNICTLWDNRTRYQCMGGGYDMLGTVLAQYLSAKHMDKIKTLIPHREPDGNYGLNRSKLDGSLYITGACGLECMLKISEKAGVRVTQDRSGRKGTLKGFFVSWSIES